MQKRGGGVEDVRCGVWAVLRILFCALGFDVVLGGALCFGLYLGFGCGIWEVLVYCGFGRVEILV